MYYESFNGIKNKNIFIERDVKFICNINNIINNQYRFILTPYPPSVKRGIKSLEMQTILKFCTQKDVCILKGLIPLCTSEIRS